MTENTGPYYLSKLKRHFLWLRITELSLWSMAGGASAYASFTLLGYPAILQITAFIITTIIVFFAGFILRNLNRINEYRITRYLDFKYEILENSCSLLLRGYSSLNYLERLQREKVTAILEKISPTIKIPQRIPLAAIVFISTGTLALVLSSFESVTTIAGKKIQAEDEMIHSAIPSSIRQLEIKITPPSYTGLRQYITDGPQLTIPEGSRVDWKINFTHDPADAQIVIGYIDSLHLNKTNDGDLNTSTHFNNSTFYQIRWKGQNDSTHSLSNFYKIETIEDRVPDISVKNPTQFVELSIGDKHVIPLSVLLRDDYDLRDSYVVATVSKGSGEAVKFREERLRFTSPLEIKGKAVHAAKDIDLAALGLHPGDELYFYVIAFDNKIPKPNYSRSETFFISILDTASTGLSFDAGLGVDLMPEYFRSQRQIIIDSEKLLRERKTITKQEFNARSNELAYDQKVLRLRYGQFLGEEFESGIISERHQHEDQGPDHSETESEEEDIAREFGHDHDRNNEQHAPEDVTHVHDEEDHEESDPIKEFIHLHDDPEEATFFSQSIRAKLKATLTIMWDAELHLRLFDPEKSLPYQYKALKLLKEISNESRIYVHRTGFDAPPIKEDKRLTGDLTEARSTTDNKMTFSTVQYPNIRHAINAIDKLLSMAVPKIMESDKLIFRNAGRELGVEAIAQPGKYLETLSLLQKITTERLSANEMLLTLERTRTQLYRIIPVRASVPGQRETSLHEVDSLFIENLFTP